MSKQRLDRVLPGILYQSAANMGFQNVVGLFVTEDKRRILTITRQDGYVGFPGGRIQNTNKQLLDAFEEIYISDTGNKLPVCQLFDCYVYNSHTLFIIWNIAGNYIETKLNCDSQSNGKIISLRLTQVSYLKQALNDHCSFQLHPYAINSTSRLFEVLGL